MKIYTYHLIINFFKVLFLNYYYYLITKLWFMKIKLLKSKIHRAIATDANLEYEGSITIDEELMKSWWRADEELMMSWWRADDELMKSWWRADEELIKSGLIATPEALIAANLPIIVCASIFLLFSLSFLSTWEKWSACLRAFRVKSNSPWEFRKWINWVWKTFK